MRQSRRTSPRGSTPSLAPPLPSLPRSLDLAASLAPPFLASRARTMERYLKELLDARPASAAARAGPPALLAFLAPTPTDARLADAAPPPILARPSAISANSPFNSPIDSPTAWDPPVGSPHSTSVRSEAWGGSAAGSARQSGRIIAESARPAGRHSRRIPDSYTNGVGSPRADLGEHLGEFSPSAEPSSRRSSAASAATDDLPAGRSRHGSSLLLRRLRAEAVVAPVRAAVDGDDLQVRGNRRVDQ